MENSNNILKELRDISAVVADIGRQAPYTVPAGYFEGLANRLLQLVKADETSSVLPIANNPYQVPQGYFEGLANNILQRVTAEEESFSPALQQANNNPYEVPQGYFEGFANNMLQRVKAEEVLLSPALQQASNNPYEVPQSYFESLANNMLQRVKAEEAFSPALQQANNNPYRVPQGYFESLPLILLSRVKATAVDNVNEELEILSPLLSQIGKKMPFSTPAGYFNELGENAISGAQAIDFVNIELENLSPLMQGLKRLMVYEAPAGYFNQLPGQVMKAIKAQQPARVVSMSLTRRVFRYAAAAVVAGLIVTAGWIYLGTGPAKEGEIPEIAKLDSLSDETLQKYLENQLSTPAETAIAATTTVEELDANDMKDMLADVTDEDLQVYLEKYSTVKNIQTN
ncbi:MAG TPA: hypothetical protein VM187_18535 [Niastella sp.]|nr:hypothetical protein [Niastella sp.]